MITVPVGATHDMESMGRFILENRERLTPMLVALNRALLATDSAVSMQQTRDIRTGLRKIQQSNLQLHHIILPFL